MIMYVIHKEWDQKSHTRDHKCYAQHQVCYPPENKDDIEVTNGIASRPVNCLMANDCKGDACAIILDTGAQAHTTYHTEVTDVTSQLGPNHVCDSITET